MACVRVWWCRGCSPERRCARQLPPQVVQRIFTQLDEAQMWSKTSALVALPAPYLECSVTHDYNNREFAATIDKEQEMAEQL